MRHGPDQALQLAGILSGAWRPAPPPLTLAATIGPEILTLLQETGAGSLAYGRLCRSGLQQSAAARYLRQTYRLHTLEAAVSHRQLADLVQRFRTAGIEPLLVKGWSISRLYPEPGMRPYGDIDLCVPPEKLETATEVLTEAAGACGTVDLHKGVADLDDRKLDEVYQRSRLVRLGEVEVRILGAEDQLRHLCLHLMRHGAWRPLWLCDVGAALESLPADFDWDYCRSGDRWLTDWMIAAISLAGKLLGARASQGKQEVPDWITASVLRTWQQGAEGNDALVQPFSACLGSWKRFRTALGKRWPNPIRAAFKLRKGPFSRFPRPMMQTAAFSLRGCQYARYLLKQSKPEDAGKPFALHPQELR